jgi:hypothetical protein
MTLRVLNSLALVLTSDDAHASGVGDGSSELGSSGNVHAG